MKMGEEAELMGEMAVWRKFGERDVVVKAGRSDEL
jgi:hypothetical protein